ncbi:unnamed protein product [Caenorhabditis auriculariae]|uniref:Protein kinase domain-containing protein n=1 Tax=Caenorhabditis auriculariae TaxID=2777116 RepID=A0A8S1HY70_9PELO|nr:unnamed protein product [Caenorhabditis auriculariae]
MMIHHKLCAFGDLSFSDSLIQIGSKTFRQTDPFTKELYTLVVASYDFILGEVFLQKLPKFFLDYQNTLGVEPREFYLRNPINRTYGSFRANEIKVVRILGHGAFGEVALANISHPAFSQDKAAIKTVLKDHPNRRELEEKFIREGRISIPLDQKNVVRTLGWCFDSKPLQLVFKYCPGGALDSYLIAKSDQLSNTALTKLCLDAARGLTYLHDVGVLHRDIAARNCLMDAKGNVKIADFGLSVKAYYYEMVVAENLPTRYLAPECLVRFSFNAQTDIFAFGHLVCEIHNKCEIPYAGMSGLEARKEIAAGKSADRPQQSS